MGSLKKVLKKAADPLGLFTSPDIKVPEMKTPAQQLTRQEEVGADDITMGTDDETSTAAKGKRALLRPSTGSSLGGI
ncbi:hypothetical protein phD2B_0029 [Lelliottia phage phD2B]|uniref:Uncharacterized protein n=1 Tax=Lelliottia phage phD2B TaxID=1542498 RepID=A0A088FT66_9CAUD|nr:hypothetical protein phD2B_0029 [Lelliottia phage phD2B]AIM51255.1 hypothetical protein phD2B_0029 [Lelliottia phage phD2B]